MRTFSAKENEQKPQWYLIDAENQVLGKVAVLAATILRGKNKVTFTPHINNGDYVIVINAAKVTVTGKKNTNKIYMTYSGYIGGEKRENFSQLQKRRPELLIERAVRGMLPHNRLGRKLMTKLKVYPGEKHPHQAQKPITIELSRK